MARQESCLVPDPRLVTRIQPVRPALSNLCAGAATFLWLGDDRDPVAVPMTNLMLAHGFGVCDSVRLLGRFPSPLSLSFNRDDEPESDTRSALVKEGLRRPTARATTCTTSSSPTAATDTQPVRLVPVSRIDSGDLPADHSVASLADSIVALGIVQPLLDRAGRHPALGGA